ncbi:MAG: (2Fe-2S)-binding protein [Candidatus Rokubacteria bacterium]|nr:(2Fe-2S)-binding protein [Candidatus Rokubacteria bacterium]MBI2553492.1 (2Fe-2S)-binding protein [Candidatus Rokubacteria bacterium]
MVTLSVNGKSHRLDVEPDTPLLYVLRDSLGLHGPKFGCGLDQCATCMVLMDGDAVRTCRVPVSRAAGRKIVTLEGLGTADKPHPIQKAFIEERAIQCGYCLNGMIITAKALLDKKRNPSDREIKQALAGSLCRCGVHLRVIRAVKRAAVRMAKEA